MGTTSSAFICAAELSLKANFEIVTENLSAKPSCISNRTSSTRLGLATKPSIARAWRLRTAANSSSSRPAVREFGEDKGIDSLIRKYGYRGTPATLAAVEANPELADDLSAAAHLIHGSSEGRFTITWCPGHLTREEIEGVGYRYGDLDAMLRLYDPAKLNHGYNEVDGEEIFFIANPGLGLWAHSSRLGTAAGPKLTVAGR